jgi:hypothetical protein
LKFEKNHQTCSGNRTGLFLPTRSPEDPKNK